MPPSCRKSPQLAGWRCAPRRCREQIFLRTDSRVTIENRRQHHQRVLAKTARRQIATLGFCRTRSHQRSHLAPRSCPTRRRLPRCWRCRRRAHWKFGAAVSSHDRRSVEKSIDLLRLMRNCRANPSAQENHRHCPSIAPGAGFEPVFACEKHESPPALVRCSLQFGIRQRCSSFVGGFLKVERANISSSGICVISASPFRCERISLSLPSSIQPCNGRTETFVSKNVSSSTTAILTSPRQRFFCGQIGERNVAIRQWHLR